VNGQIVNVPSFHVRSGDVITIRPKSRDLELINESLNSSSPGKYKWLEIDKKSKTGKYLNDPLKEEIPENINVQLIIELYSK
jgi:small subunit ribosomal protein S4